LRSSLADQGAPALHAALATVDPELACRLSPHDAPRILRGLEVVRSSGRALSAWQADHRFAEQPYDLLSLVLSPPTGELDRRIAARSVSMWDSGLAEETAAVLAAGFAGDLPPLRAIGYREAQRFLRGEMGREAAIDAIARATRQYAKRQRTWFRRLEDAVWLDGCEARAAIRDRAAAFLGARGDAAHVS